MDAPVAYLAGFFDGEGYVGIHKTGGRYALRVSVTQLDPRPPILFQQRYGGNIHRAPDKRGFRALIVWTLVAGRAAAMLEEIRPLLVVKADQVDAALEFQRRMSSPVTDRASEIVERERLYQLVRDLKQVNYDAVELPKPEPVVQDHKGKRLRWAKPKLPKAVRAKVAEPVRSTGYDRSKKPSATELAEAYEALGANDTARRYGVSRQTFYNWLDAYGIPRQGRTEASEARRKTASAKSWRPMGPGSM